MYQIETVPVPILDENEQAHSYMELKIEKLYTALNEETYITLHTGENEQAHSYMELKIEKLYTALNEETYITLHAQELKMCKKIGYEYYCKELFVIKSKTNSYPLGKRSFVSRIFPGVNHLSMSRPLCWSFSVVQLLELYSAYFGRYCRNWLSFTALQLYP